MNLRKQFYAKNKICAFLVHIKLKLHWELEFEHCRYVENPEFLCIEQLSFLYCNCDLGRAIARSGILGMENRLKF